MNSINTNFNNNYGLDQRKIGFKADTQAAAIQQDVQLPDMYYMPDYANRPQSFKEKLKKYDLMGLIYNWFEHPFLMLGTCLGISYGVGKAEKSFAREYAESSLGKAAALGDKLEQSAFVQNKTTQNILGGIKKGWDGTINFLKKSSVIKAMLETPSQPENSMPKSEMKHTEANIVDRFKSLIGDFGLNKVEAKDGKAPKIPEIKLNELDVSAKELEGIKTFFGSGAITEEQAVGKVMLERLGKSEAEIKNILSSGNIQENVIKEIKNTAGLTDEMIEKIMKDEVGNPEIVKTVEEASFKLKNLKIKKGRLKAINNPKGFNEIYNRLHCIGDGAKTKTGQFFGKMLQKLYRGFTFGNSKVGVMFWVAPFLVNTIVNTKKADKKEKVGTFVDGLIQSVSWVFVFPLVLMGIHAIGGAQYAGMGKEKVEMLRKQIAKFNERVLKKDFKTKEEYNAARKGLDLRVKALKRVKNQSLLTKILRKISAFTKADLGKIEPFNNGSKLGNFGRKIPNFLKDAAYSPARFLVFMLVGMPLVDKLIGKCTSAIFGKPYDEFKEEENLENKKAQEEYTMNDLRERMLEVQRRKLNPELNTANTQSPETEAAMAELAAAAAGAGVGVNGGVGVNSGTEQQAIQQTPVQNKAPEQEFQQPQPQIQPVQQVQQQVVQNPTVKRDNYTYIPSQENVLNNINPQAQINKYIPSQIGAKFSKTFDNSGLDAALRRANNAEKRALGVLSGNFSTRY